MSCSYSPNAILTAMSGLLSIVLMVVNTAFPKCAHTEAYRQNIKYVRETHALLKSLLFCSFCGR